MSNKNELNELSKKVKAISRKGLTKRLTTEFCILNGAKYFRIVYSLCQLKNTLNIFLQLLELLRGNLIECQKKILQI